MFEKLRKKMKNIIKKKNNLNYKDEFVTFLNNKVTMFNIF